MTNPPAFASVDSVEQGHVPIIRPFQEKKNLHMKLAMRPDTVLFTRETLGLSDAQATQACSSHIVVGLADLTRAPTNHLRNGNDHYPNFLAGDQAMSLGVCLACVGSHRPHACKEGCKMVQLTAPGKDASPPSTNCGQRSPDQLVRPNSSCATYCPR